MSCVTYCPFEVETGGASNPPSADANNGHVSGEVDVVEYLGADTFLIINCGAQGQVTMRAGGDNQLEPGAKVGLVFPDDKLHFFDEVGKSF